MINLKQLFKRRPEVRLEDVQRSFTSQNDHLIAIARLAFIKPEVLVREAHNVKANSEYLFEMIKAQEKMLERKK